MSMPLRAKTFERKWALDEFHRARDAAPGGERWEYVDGEVLVTPSPNVRHQLLVQELAIRLDPFVRRHRLGRVLTAPLDVTLDPGVIVQPDVMVVQSGKVRPSGADAQAVLLAIEVTSPHSARFDRVTKRPRYQRSPVPDYWIVDDVAGIVERWTPTDERPQIVTEQLVWQPAGVTEALELDLPALFADVAEAYRELTGSE